MIALSIMPTVTPGPTTGKGTEKLKKAEPNRLNSNTKVAVRADKGKVSDLKSWGAKVMNSGACCGFLTRP